MRSTGPKSAEGKAKSARNGYKGGFRPKLRTLARELNAALREQREVVRKMRP